MRVTLDRSFTDWIKVACEQALWSGKERRKGKREENKGRARQDTGGGGFPSPSAVDVITAQDSW